MRHVSGLGNKVDKLSLYNFNTISGIIENFNRSWEVIEIYYHKDSLVSPPRLFFFQFYNSHTTFSSREHLWELRSAGADSNVMNFSGMPIRRKKKWDPGWAR